ncbi:MAG: pseudouridine synthase [Clostridia bacterium]
MRINKYIAMCGVCSRRKAEELVLQGKIKVNGKVIDNLGTDINEENDTVMLDNVKIFIVTKKEYIMFHKPKGCICSLSDEKDRKTIMDYLTDFDGKKIFPVGRLDYDTEGLLLLTNDGEFSNKLTQPINEIPKTYIAIVDGELTSNDVGILRGGMVIDGVKLRKSKVKILENENNQSRVEITIYEGKNRQVRKMFDCIGKNVILLRRIKIGDLKLGGLTRGTYRYLTNKEVSDLLKL